MVIGGHRFEEDLRDGVHVPWSIARPEVLASIPNVGVGAAKSRLGVVRLLRGDAIEADRPGAETSDRRVPESMPDPPTPQLGPHEVEAPESERGPVSDGRYCADRLTAQFRHEETVRIRRPKAASVVQSRVPALDRAQSSASSSSSGAMGRTPTSAVGVTDGYRSSSDSVGPYA